MLVDATMRQVIGLKTAVVARRDLRLRMRVPARVGFDERAALGKVGVPRLAFAGADDTIVYSPKWGDATVVIGDALQRNAAELTALGWRVQVLEKPDHLAAMQASRVLPILIPFLRSVTG